MCVHSYIVHAHVHLWDFFLCHSERCIPEWDLWNATVLGGCAFLTVFPLPTTSLKYMSEHRMNTHCGSAALLTPSPTFSPHRLVNPSIFMQPLQESCNMIWKVKLCLSAFLLRLGGWLKTWPPTFGLGGYTQRECGTILISLKDHTTHRVSQPPNLQRCRGSTTCFHLCKTQSRIYVTIKLTELKEVLKEWLSQVCKLARASVQRDQFTLWSKSPAGVQQNQKVSLHVIDFLPHCAT